MMSIKRHYMETILAPTDFSKPADNAVTYAAEVAKLTKAKLILLHVYIIPITSGESAVLLPPCTDIQTDCFEALELNRILKEHNTPINLLIMKTSLGALIILSQIKRRTCL